MTLLPEIALKSAAIFLVALAAAALLRRYSAALRHFVLARAFICAAAVPALTIWSPAWDLRVPASWLPGESASPLTFSDTPTPSSAVSPSPKDSHVRPASTRATTLQLAFGVWFAGALAGIGGMCAGMWRIGRVARRARTVATGPWREHADDIAALYRLRRPVQLLHSSHPAMLVTWGQMRPRVLIPADATAWSDERIRVVLYHELAHVQRHDWTLLIVARSLRALHWFNPLAWIAFRRFREESERACDDIVLGRGITAPDYASHLLAVAREDVRHRTWSAAAAIANPSMLEGRIRAMLNQRVDRTPLTARGRWVAAFVSLVVAVAIASAGISALAAPAGGREPASRQLAGPVLIHAAEQHATIDLSNATAALRAARVSAARARVEVPSAAQSTPGAVSGFLYDQLGGVLPGVQVQLLNQTDGAKYDTLSDRNGGFVFTALPASDYELRLSLPGFATVSNLIKVVPGATVERAVTLPIGTLEETVAVVGGAGSRAASSPRPPRAVHASATPEPRTFFSGGIGGQIKVPTKIVHVNPVYPAEAGNASDVVVLTGRVGIDGFINDLREVRPAPNTVLVSRDAFVKSALDAVSQWEFTPVLLNNVPVEAHITIRVDYSAR